MLESGLKINAMDMVQTIGHLDRPMWAIGTMECTMGKENSL